MAKIKNRPNFHHTKPRLVNKRAFERVYWPYIPLVIAISLLLGIGASGGNLQAYVRHPGGRVLSYATSMTISGLLADTNASRATNGVAALNLNAQLDAAAQANADDMAARDYWSHYSPEGNPPWIWVTNEGYSYQKLGQNLATGFSDEQSTIDGWMNSPPHRQNLLDPAFKDVGFGFANSANYTAAGGGPMTIVVAFYGQPQVLSAATPAPAAPATKPPSLSAAAPQPTASQPTSGSPPAATPQPVDSGQTPTKPKTSQPVTSQSTVNTQPPPQKQSRIELALANSRVAPVASASSIFIALGLFAFWGSRHLLAIRKFVLRGERYALSHPLTDIGLLIVACLLFILSQTAGLIR